MYYYTKEINEREEVGASADMIVYKAVGDLLLAKIFDWVGPENIAHEPMRRGLAEAIDLYETR